MFPNRPCVVVRNNTLTLHRIRAPRWSEVSLPGVLACCRPAMKASIMKAIESLKQGMNNSLKEIEEKYNKKIEEMS